MTRTANTLASSSSDQAAGRSNVVCRHFDQGHKAHQPSSFARRRWSAMDVQRHTVPLGAALPALFARDRVQQSFAVLRSQTLERLGGRHRRSSTAVAVLASIAVLQLTGYVGPQWRRLAAEQAASGFRAHEEWMTSPRRRGEELVRMLATAEALQVERAAPGADARWCYIDIDRAEPMPTLADTWVAALVGDLDVARVRLAAALDPLHQPHVVSPHIAADVLTTIYPTIARADLRLVVSHALGTELVGRGAPWRTPGLLWVLSGRDLAPLVPE